MRLYPNRRISEAVKAKRQKSFPASTNRCKFVTRVVYSLANTVTAGKQMELILGLATLLEIVVVGVLVYALWQDRREASERQSWEHEMRTLTHGEDLNAMTR